MFDFHCVGFTETFITLVVVITIVMPVQSVNFSREQYSYILQTSDEGEFSERVREIVNKGIEQEQ